MACQAKTNLGGFVYNETYFGKNREETPLTRAKTSQPEMINKIFEQMKTADNSDGSANAKVALVKSDSDVSVSEQILFSNSDEEERKQRLDETCQFEDCKEDVNNNEDDEDDEFFDAEETVCQSMRQKLDPSTAKQVEILQNA